MQERDEIEYKILKIIDSADDPIGSGTISEQLQLMGANVSEATAGRILRELDNKGYSERRAYRGRLLTPLGRMRLQELERERERSFLGKEFLEVLKVGGKEELLEVLVARRAIERESARLAAIHATNQEIEVMEKIIERHKQHFRDPGGAENDVQFHKMVVKAARNRVLEAATELIRQDAQLSPIFAYIRNSVHSTMVEDHQKILDAIKKHSPQEADEAMVRHIENLMRDVERYWEEAT